MTAQRSMPIAVAALVLATSACGTRSYIVADEAKYPISLSSAVRDERGQVVPADKLQKLGTFKDDYTTCSMLWTIIPLKARTRDISEKVNEEVSKREGEAIVNLRVESGTMFSSAFSLVGLLPDCNNVKVRGDIVERIPAPKPNVASAKPAPAPAAAPAPAPAPAPAVAPADPATPAAPAAEAAPAAPAPTAATGG